MICEGPHVAIQTESDTVTANGMTYRNRYHFYIRFEEFRIAQLTEYSDIDLIREVYLPGTRQSA